MNKELTPLEALERLLITFKPYVDENKYIKRDFDIIETALKDYELYEKILKDYGFNFANFREACFTLAQFRGSGFTNIEKKLKALEIIKEKPQTLYLVKTCKNYNDYFEIANDMALIEDIYNKEEFDLLKEILK